MSSMRLDFSLQQQLSTELRMAPHIIQSIEILTLPALELHTFIQEQLEINPVLETQEATDSQTKKEEQPAEDSQQQIDENFLNNFENLESDDWREYFSEGSENYTVRKYSDDKDKKFEALQNTAARPMSLSDYLYQQFQLFDLPEKIKKVGEYILYNIDEKGYLRYPLEDIIKPLEGEASTEDAELALTYVQKLEPAGVGARTIEECLLLQLDKNDPNYAFTRELIEKYLYDIYNNKYPKIIKETGKTLDEIKEAIASLQKLNPKPGDEYSAESTHIIMPDVVVEYIEDEYIIRLEEQYIPQLRISSLYRRLLDRENKNRKAKEFIKKKMESANWVIDAIKQRQRTLYRVAEEIVNHQREFLDHGLTHLKPLKMQDVADALNISVSTVSRAISDKYIQTPRGIFPLKFFFTGAIEKCEGRNESRVSVKQRIQEIVDHEDKTKPLSDEEIAERLKTSGLNIAPPHYYQIS